MADSGWIVWYEDQAGPGDPAIFLSKASAEARIKELLELLLRDQDDIELGEDATELLNEIKQLLAQGDIMGALSEWETFYRDFTPDGNLVVKEAEIVP